MIFRQIAFGSALVIFEENVALLLYSLGTRVLTFDSIWPVVVGERFLARSGETDDIWASLERLIDRDLLDTFRNCCLFSCYVMDSGDSWAEIWSFVLRKHSSSSRGTFFDSSCACTVEKGTNTWASG